MRRRANKWRRTAVVWNEIKHKLRFRCNTKPNHGLAPRSIAPARLGKD